MRERERNRGRKESNRLHLFQHSSESTTHTHTHAHTHIQTYRELWATKQNLSKYHVLEQPLESMVDHWTACNANNIPIVASNTQTFNARRTRRYGLISKTGAKPNLEPKWPFFLSLSLSPLFSFSFNVMSCWTRLEFSPEYFIIIIWPNIYYHIYVKAMRLAGKLNQRKKRESM